MKCLKALPPVLVVARWILCTRKNFYFFLKELVISVELGVGEPLFLGFCDSESSCTVDQYGTSPNTEQFSLGQGSAIGSSDILGIVDEPDPVPISACIYAILADRKGGRSLEINKVQIRVINPAEIFITLDIGGAGTLLSQVRNPGFRHSTTFLFPGLPE